MANDNLGPIPIHFHDELVSESTEQDRQLNETFGVHGKEMQTALTLLWLLMRKSGMAHVSVKIVGQQVQVEVQ